MHGARGAQSRPGLLANIGLGRGSAGPALIREVIPPTAGLCGSRGRRSRRRSCYCPGIPSGSSAEEFWRPLRATFAHGNLVQRPALE
ncbi:hypothetical protein NDU88_000790 [Pleurodeles waltl]|uniref:Uncharacterized protein n=1 Tax=Pleurodeles waltl TaxID=8319 RepID=A0AAV7MJM4_PLEWA|nr:hypothetical protein NDU88_000790 [Pleurodeles waltl]